MNGIKLKIVFILLMLIPLPFSCVDTENCIDLDVLPYYKVRGLVFDGVDNYFINPSTKKLMPLKVSQDYEKYVYSCDSMALFFKVPDTSLRYHAQIDIKRFRGFTREAFACNVNRPGYKGTFDLIDKIFISSNYDFDETHLAGYDLSDIVDIFAYTIDENDGGFWSLTDYNEQSPQIAPKRFYLLLKRNARLSPIQQFVVRYHLLGEDGGPPTEFRVETPVFNVRTSQ